MLESIIKTSAELSIEALMYCTLTSVGLGIIIALVHRFTSKYNKNFLITLAILPILVQSIILMVSGNLGTSVAILGAFGLVRFRSLPGTSKEILSVFFSMTVGLATGMGQLLFAAIITGIVSALLIIFSKIKFGEKSSVKVLKVTLPDNLDYTEVFDDIFDKYLKSYTLEKVKTTNLGSLFEITYNVVVKSGINEKEFIDNIRSRNGNLKISLSHPIDSNEL